MRTKLSLRYGLFAAAAILLACAKSESDPITNTTADNCREYAADYTVTINGGTPTSFTCAWNGTTFKLVCTDGANTYSYLYPSLLKFVDEIDVLAKPAYTNLIISGGTTAITINSFDSNSKLTGTTVFAPTANLNQEFTYSAFDTSGRPTLGTYTVSGGQTCTNATVSYAYDNTAKTSTQIITGGTGADCVTSTTTSFYDSDTGIDKEIVSSVSASNATKTVNTKAKVCS